jgi:hypothetical protein
VVGHDGRAPRAGKVVDVRDVERGDERADATALHERLGLVGDEPAATGIVDGGVPRRHDQRRDGLRGIGGFRHERGSLPRAFLVTGRPRLAGARVGRADGGCFDR